MIKKELLITGCLLFIVIFLIGIITLNRNFLYLPFEYKKSEIIPLDRTDFKMPLRLEICYITTIDDDYKCYFTTDRKEIKSFISLFQNLKYERMNELNYWQRTPNRYDIVLRKMTSEEDGYHLFDIYYEMEADFGYTTIGEFNMTSEIINYIESRNYTVVN